MTNATHNHAAPYSQFFKAWHNVTMGAKPEVDSLAVAHGLGLRPGKQALALAMFLRPGGASREQIGAACGAPQFNRSKALAVGGFIKRDMTVPNDAAGRMVYRYELTARGRSVIERAAKAATADTEAPKADKPKKGPAKAKGARKGAKATPVALPAPEATSEAPTGFVGPVTEAPAGPVIEG